MKTSEKKLLILGASETEIFIIERAKKLGIYTIVTDYREDMSIVPAKAYADEYWNISWSDIDSLYKKCIEEDVDGVISGFSEFRVENMIKLCERLHKPTYLTSEQLETTRDKVKFKKCCDLYKIPTVPQYQLDSENIVFPVIVKPVDRGGSIGISVCYNKEDYRKSLDYALNMSGSKQVVVEKYFGEDTKFDVYYCIQDGIPVFFGSNDTIMCPPNEGLEILQSSWIFPSKHESLLKEKLDEPICAMLKGLGIKDGYITISGFIDRGNNVYVFETGFRLSGELSFKYSEYEYNNNYIDMLIEIALTGSCENKNYTNRLNQGKMLVVNYYGKQGIIGNRLNVPLDDNSEIVDYKKHTNVIGKSTALLPKCGMLFIKGKNYEDILSTYQKNFSAYDICDESGNSLIYYRPSVDVLNKYFQQ